MASQGRRLMNCRFPQPQASLRLFCFPWGGGGSNFYAAWGETLPSHIEVLGIMLPARESRFREEPCSDAQQTVAEITTTIAQEYADKPFIFFGHSMGSLLCYEIAALLKKQHGLQPEHVYLSGSYAAHSKAFREKTFDLNFISDEDYKEYLRKLGGTPPEILDSDDWFKLCLPPLRADYKMVSQLVHEKPEDCPVLSCDFTYFDGTDDHDHHYDDWRELSSGSFTLHKLPGHHFYLKDPSNLQFILTTIQSHFPLAI